jgi:hypothetical protein
VESVIPKAVNVNCENRQDKAKKQEKKGNKGHHLS